MFKAHGLIPTHTSGLSLNPVKNKWSLTSSTAVNYITAATKSLKIPPFFLFSDEEKERGKHPGLKAQTSAFPFLFSLRYTLLHFTVFSMITETSFQACVPSHRARS